MAMKMNEIMELIEKMAKVYGEKSNYGKLYSDLMGAKEKYPDYYEEIKQDWEEKKFSTPVDFMKYFDGEDYDYDDEVRKYAIDIDLVDNTNGKLFEENICILESPKFDSEIQAREWLEDINLDECDLNHNGMGLDLIMVVYDEEGHMLDSWVI